MKISFPVMGNSYVVFKQLVENLGHKAIVPPLPTDKTLTLGTMYAPEFACIPFKIMLGSYLEAIEKGAEVIISSGGHGPCRAGYYGILHQKIIEDLGYDTKVVIFDSLLKSGKEFVSKIRWLLKTGKKNWLHLGKILRTAWIQLKALDDLEVLSYQIRPRELSRGKTTQVYRQCLKLMEKAVTISEVKKTHRACKEMLQKIPQDHEKEPLKIGIIGEIYVLIEPFANLDIQARLGEMGAYTERSMHLYHWLTENTKVSREERKIIELAQPYLGEMIGGHGINSIGETVSFAQRGFDGVIQLAPFSCIPEIVAKGILPRVSEIEDIPVMTIFLDEMMGKAGMQTRLEAFVDLLSQRREYKLAKVL